METLQSCTGERPQLLPAEQRQSWKDSSQETTQMGSQHEVLSGPFPTFVMVGSVIIRLQS